MKISRRHVLALPALSALHAASREPAMKWADASRLGRPFSKDPSVIRFGSSYLMYYSMPAPVDRSAGWGIGIAESRDLVRWHKIGEVAPEHEYESAGIAAPGARVTGGRVHLFYQTYGKGRNDAICHADSADGIRFVRNPTNPVFRPTGSWNAGRAIDADVIQFRDRWYLYAATRDPEMKVQMITGAVSEGGFDRDSWKLLADGPLLRPELAWERDCIEAPSMLVRGRTLYMFYAGGYNNAPQQIGCARSSDGIHFERLFTEPLLANGAPGDWNSSESGHPGVLDDAAGNTRLFYQGNNDNGRTWYLSQVELGWRNGKPYVKPAQP